MYRSDIIYNLEEYMNFTKKIIKREDDLDNSSFCSPLISDYPLIAIIHINHEYGNVTEEFISYKDFKEVINV